MEILWPNPATPPPLASGEAHLWAVPLDVTSTQTSIDLELLSSDERNRAREFQIEAPRRRFTFARIALRTLLGQYLEVAPQAIEFNLGANGKPRLCDGHAIDLRFNVSHSGNLVLIAVAIGCEVGVDVEQLRKVDHLEQISRRFLHPREVEDVSAADAATRDEAFLKCWTGKEAVLKAVGRGVAGSLDRFYVPIDSPGSAWIDLPANEFDTNSRCWLQAITPRVGYVSAVAFVNTQPSLHCFRLEA